MDTHGEKTGIFAKKGLWIGIGAGLFILIAYILPTPPSLVEVMEKYGYVEKMMDWGIARIAGLPDEDALNRLPAEGLVPQLPARAPAGGE